MADEEPQLRRISVPEEANGQRLDLFLVQQLSEISRSRVQLLLQQGSVLIDGKLAKASRKLRSGENISILGDPQPPPLRTMAEAIRLEMVYEDQDIAVVNKPAGMMVHAGSGATDDARNRGTLVNALLHHFNHLSDVGGDLRPGIVHRLDKQTSGIILVAKDDSTHRKLGEMFSLRRVAKTYIALVHGHVAKDDTTINLPIARDLIRRIRMTTRRADGRTAVSHVHVLERLNSIYGAFTLVEVRIETGRTHQIRVHMQALGHPVVGDHLYGAPHNIPNSADPDAPLSLDRNFLHAAHLSFAHPQTGKPMDLEAPLPPELQSFLETLRNTPGNTPPAKKSRIR